MRLGLRLDSSQARRVSLALLCFVLIALDVMSGGLVSNFDQTLREWVQPQPVSVASWLGLARDLGKPGVSAALLGIAGAVASHLLWKIWPFVFAAAVFLVTEGLVYLTKTVVGREGPGVWVDRADYPGYYPSGHTALAAVCAGSVVFLALLCQGGVRDVARAAAFGSGSGMLVGALAAWHSVVGDFHWLSDGLGGLLLAYCVLTLAFAVVQANDRHPGKIGRPHRR